MLPTTDLISAPDLLLCELLLHDPVGLMPISKQSPEGGPLELDGRKGEFDRRVRRLTALLLVTIRDDERDALRELRDLLKRDWPNLGQFDRERILERAAEIIERIPRGDPIALRNRVEAAAIVLARRARRAAVRAFDLNAPAEQPSDSVVRGMELAMPASRFIQDEYSRRGVAFQVAGLAIIAASLLAGDSAEDIERKLLARAGKAIDRPDYLKSVATAVLTQARTSSLLDTYAEAGVVTYQVLEVLDERTCFPAGTQVLLSSGERKAIESVQIGDEVVTRQGRSRRVLNTFAKYATTWARIRFSTGEIIYSTIDHEFATEGGGWLRADQLCGAWVESIRPARDASMRQVQDHVQRSSEQRGALQELFSRLPTERNQDQEMSWVRKAHRCVPRELGTKEALLRAVSPAALHLEVPDVRSSVQSGSGEVEDCEVLLASVLPQTREADVNRVGCGERVALRSDSVHRRGPNRQVGRRFPSQGPIDSRGGRGLLAHSLEAPTPGAKTRLRDEEDGLWSAPTESVPDRAGDQTHPGFDFGCAQVASVSIEHRPALAYDIEVEEDHSYVVEDGFVVHNCDKCRFMFGTEFTVASGRDLLGRVAAERLPEAIADINPFLREGVNADREPIIFLVRDGRRTQLAVIKTSRVGTVNRLGRFDPPADPAQLTRLGVGPPPYHPDCRGVVVPS